MARIFSKVFFSKPTGAFRLSSVVRLGVGVGWIWGGYRAGMGGEGGGEIAGVLMIVFGCFFFAPEMKRLLAEPVGRLFAGLFFPQASGNPPLDYTLPRFYRKKERLPEAMEHYRRILHYYPRELTAYREGIEVAVELGEWGEARALLKRALRKIPTQERESLRAHWAALEAAGR
jgi:hypothetical protein